MQTKLTLSVDPAVVARAKRFAKKQGISVSQMVETYLWSVTQPVEPELKHSPVVNSLRGILRKGDREDYRRYLVKKYL